MQQEDSWFEPCLGPFSKEFESTSQHPALLGMIVLWQTYYQVEECGLGPCPE